MIPYWIPGGHTTKTQDLDMRMLNLTGGLIHMPSMYDISISFESGDGKTSCIPSWSLLPLFVSPPHQV